ncbi:hypothetical protein MTR62_20270, partial [Novosphingobium sp. 1949]
MDYWEASYYLLPMANRLLLTLLALLTGLAAQTDARVARAAQVAAVVNFSQMADAAAQAKASRAPVALARLPEPGRRNTRLFAPAART